MNNTTDRAINMDMYAIYLRKSRADLEAEKLGEGSYSGWYTDVIGDDDLYQTAYDAMNAIDERLGGSGKLG